MYVHNHRRSPSLQSKCYHHPGMNMPLDREPELLERRHGDGADFEARVAIFYSGLARGATVRYLAQCSARPQTT